MRFRIIKETIEKDDGSNQVFFYPQKKGWFFWNYFYYYNGTCPFEYRFGTSAEAERFIEREVKNSSPSATIVVKEFTINQKEIKHGTYRRTEEIQGGVARTPQTVKRCRLQGVPEEG